MVGKQFGGVEAVGERSGAGQELRDRREGQMERQLGQNRVEMGRVKERAGVWGQDGGASPPSEIDLLFL